MALSMGTVTVTGYANIALDSQYITASMGDAVATKSEENKPVALLGEDMTISTTEATAEGNGDAEAPTLSIVSSIGDAYGTEHEDGDAYPETQVFTASIGTVTIQNSTSAEAMSHSIALVDGTATTSTPGAVTLTSQVFSTAMGNMAGLSTSDWKVFPVGSVFASYRGTTTATGGANAIAVTNLITAETATYFYAYPASISFTAGRGTCTALGYIGDWLPSEPGDGTWTPIEPGSDPWTPVDPGGGLWTPVP
jgi:hypothetical protein